MVTTKVTVLLPTGIYDDNLGIRITAAASITAAEVAATMMTTELGIVLKELITTSERTLVISAAIKLMITSILTLTCFSIMKMQLHYEQKQQEQ